MTPPDSFFWQIESILEKEGTNLFQKDFLDFLHLKDFYSGREQTCLFPTFRITENPDFTASQKPVFFDEKGAGHNGLKNFSLCFHPSNPLSNQQPVYFFDNHQNALIPFFDFYEAIKTPITVVHIDAHRDDARFPYPVGNADLRSLQRKDIQEILRQCRVSDYLDAGKKMGLIGEVISVTQSTEFESCELPKTPYVLNLDIDIYGPEGSAVDTLLKTQIIAKAWKNADMVAFATSPAFIDQRFAARLGELFFETLSGD